MEGAIIVGMDILVANAYKHVLQTATLKDAIEPMGTVKNVNPSGTVQNVLALVIAVC